MLVAENELHAVAHRLSTHDKHAIADRNRGAFDAQAPALRAPACAPERRIGKPLRWLVRPKQAQGTRAMIQFDSIGYLHARSLSIC
jgi:hypothetical protein